MPEKAKIASPFESEEPMGEMEDLAEHKAEEPLLGGGRKWSLLRAQ